METFTILLVLVAVIVLLTLIIATGAYFYAKIKGKKDVAEANIKANENAKKTYDGIQELSDSALRDKFNRL